MRHDVARPHTPTIIDIDSAETGRMLSTVWCILRQLSAYIDDEFFWRYLTPGRLPEL